MLRLTRFRRHLVVRNRRSSSSGGSQGAVGSQSNIVWDNAYLRQMQRGRREAKTIENGAETEIDLDFISDVEKDESLIAQILSTQLSPKSVKTARPVSMKECTIPLRHAGDELEETACHVANGDSVQVSLHPDVFHFRIDQDAMAQTLEWQRTFKQVDMSFEQDRMETGEKVAWKPWIGSGQGFERVRDKTGPRFKGGAFTANPRRPYLSKYYRLDRNIKISALCSCLTIKHFQNDLIVVSRYDEIDDLAVTLEEIAGERECTFMVIGDSGASHFSSLSTSERINVFGFDGINLESMLKYDKLVLDMVHLRKLEAKLHFERNRYDMLESHDENEHPMLDRFWQDIMGKWKDEKFNHGPHKSGQHKFYSDWPKF